MEETQRAHLASYAILRKGSKVAFVKRSNTDWMNGYYSLPAGKVEKEETFSKGAVREALEEVGIRIELDKLRFACVQHRYSKGDSKPYWVDIYFEGDTYEGEPFNAEPDLHSELAWLDTSNLPDNVLGYIKAALADIEKGKKYGEFGWI